MLSLLREIRRNSALIRIVESTVRTVASNAMSSKVGVKEWHAPHTDHQPLQLMLLNSLTDKKELFVPVAGTQSKQITWYTCGPTVYDVAHMGHARNYISFDIVRRVLEDYFGYNVLFIMNVTDVDDKIIFRARRNYLMEKYRQEGHTPEQVLELARSSLGKGIAKQQAKVEAAQALIQAAADDTAQGGPKSSSHERKRKELEGAQQGEAHKLAQLQATLQELQGMTMTGNAAADLSAILGVGGDSIAETLDALHGSEVTDQSIYRAHGAKYEHEFFEDLDALGCRRPDVVTRVTEYVPEILEYVERILSNGMAYVSNGSVYFDTQKFRESGHTYGKLKPWAVGTAALACEGESNFETVEKRHSCDFALWKASKAGEPFWESPWGKGRPGWHIECSAMACSIAGTKLDIHTGGEDLKFPHHDNEIAQAEAYFHKPGCSEDCKQWVNYFMHAGHLSIEGLKMSKSLKNFVTIREALQSYSPRQLRLLFAQTGWNKPMVYGESSRQEMMVKEQLLRNFFQNVEVVLRTTNFTAVSTKWMAEDHKLCQQVVQAQEAVHRHLLDNIDTGKALESLCDLVRDVNVYLALKESTPRSVAQPLLLRKAASYVTQILSVFGVVEGRSDRLGMGDGGGTSSAAGPDGATAGGDKYLDAFAAFRDEIRSLVRNKADSGSLMAVCDKVRDHTMVDLGVRLEDKPDGTSKWKRDDPAILRAEAGQRAAVAAAAQRKKVANVLETRKKELEKFERLSNLPPPSQALADKYSQFDPTSGEPTHDKDGVVLDGKALNKAKKDFEKACKEREPLHKRQAEDPEFLTKLATEVQQLATQLAALDTTGDSAGTA